MIGFARETLETWDEAWTLVESHYHEIAHFRDLKLKPNRDGYLQCESAGGIRVYTVRDDGRLVGYQVFLVSLNLHYNESLQAIQDVLYLAPDLRGRLIGYRFIRWCDEQLRAEGVEVVMQHVKVKHDFGPMLTRMGYELMENVYVKRLS